MSFELHLTQLGDVIAGIPAMLGFTPERSLVLVALKRSDDSRHRIGVVIRTDLPMDGELSDTDIAERVTNGCARTESVAALAVIVDDRLVAPTPHSQPACQHSQLLATLEQRLDGVGVELIGAWAVAEIRAGLPWWNLRESRQHGVLADPTASMVAAQRVLAGSPIHRRRADLAALVEVDRTLRGQVAAVLPYAMTQARQRLDRDIRIGNPDAYSRRALWRVMQVVKDLADSPQASSRALAEVAIALCDSPVRDCMFGVVDGRYAVPAERLWMLATRALPDPYRAEVAMLLAFCAYVRGDGPLAGVALEAALASDPDHRMAALLDLALQTGMHPDRLRKLVDAGIESAADLRIDIGVSQSDTAQEVLR